MGEAPITSYKRIDSFLGTLHRDRNKDGVNDILIVSHGATIKNFMMRWFHLPLDGWKMLQTPGNGDIFMIDDDDGDWKITRIFDGERGIPVAENPIGGIKRFDRTALPPVPAHLRAPRLP